MGLLKAGVGALGGVLADSWRDYFYCDSLDADVLVAKGENQARHILHRKANCKSDGHRKENAQNHRQSLRGVDEISQFQGIVRKNLDTGDSHRGAQKFKDH